MKNNKRPIALVTGAAGNIGSQISLELYQLGYDLILIDMDSSKLELLKGKIISKESNGQVFTLETNIASAADVQLAVKLIENKYQSLDVLINNAGISPKTIDGGRKSFTDIDDDEWDDVMAVNLKSIFLMCKYFHILLKKNKGCIVNIASMMGVTGSGINHNHIFPYSVSAAHYSASKAGVINLTKSMAREFSDDEIYVYGVAPGAVIGGMGQFDNTFIENLKEQIPTHQLGTPDQIVDAIIFLISSGNSMTGQTIHTNNGWYMRG